mgnify:CR=1 FL=1
MSDKYDVTFEVAATIDNLVNVGNLETYCNADESTKRPVERRAIV